MTPVVGSGTMHVCQKDCTLGGGSCAARISLSWTSPCLSLLVGDMWIGLVLLSRCLANVSTCSTPVSGLTLGSVRLADGDLLPAGLHVTCCTRATVPNPVHRIFVPAGTALWTPLVAIHNNDAVWEEPDTYRPERWLEPGADYLQPAAAADGGSKQQQSAGVFGGGNDAPGGGGSKPGATGPGAEAASGGRARSYEMNISRSKVRTLQFCHPASSRWGGSTDVVDARIVDEMCVCHRYFSCSVLHANVADRMAQRSSASCPSVTDAATASGRPWCDLKIRVFRAHLYVPVQSGTLEVP